MKKLILMASAALTFGGIAYAQDATMPPPAAATPDTTATPDAGAQATTGTTAPDAGGMQSTPDASGGMATPPAGTDATGGQGMSGGTQPGTATGPNGPVSMTPTQGATDLPMCSKTVTDNCKQGGKSSGTHRATHHRKHK